MRIKVKSVFFVVSSWDDRYVYSSERIWQIEGGASEPVFRLSSTTPANHPSKGHHHELHHL